MVDWFAFNIKFNAMKRKQNYKWLLLNVKFTIEKLCVVLFIGCHGETFCWVYQLWLNSGVGEESTVCVGLSDFVKNECDLKIQLDDERCYRLKGKLSADDESLICAEALKNVFRSIICTKNHAPAATGRWRTKFLCEHLLLIHGRNVNVGATAYMHIYSIRLRSNHCWCWAASVCVRLCVSVTEKCSRQSRIDSVCGWFFIRLVVHIVIAGIVLIRLILFACLRRCFIN